MVDDRGDDDRMWAPHCGVVNERKRKAGVRQMIEGMLTGCGVGGERERRGGVWRMVGMVKESQKMVNDKRIRDGDGRRRIIVEMVKASPRNGDCCGECTVVWINQE